MGRTVIADESLLTYLSNLAQPVNFSIGLILGQSTSQKDFVVHLARTPHPTSKDVNEEQSESSIKKKKKEEKCTYLKSFQEIEESWVADHAKHVTRMLPGGMWVLGVFIVGPGNVFEDNLAMSALRSVLTQIKKTLSSNTFLHGNTKSTEKLAFHMCSTTQKFICKSFDMENLCHSVKPVEWKFVSQPCKWHQLECHFSVDQNFPINENKVSQPLSKHLKNMLSFYDNKIKTALCMIDGEIKDAAECLDSPEKKKKGKINHKGQQSDKVLSVSLYIPTETNGSNGECEIINCCGEMAFSGTIISRVFLHQKATVEEAILAVKEDIMRSLASRFEMHWDSLIEEEHGPPEDRETYHEPPRRVLVALPHCRVTLSDYLFPGEGPSEALISLQDLLDLEVNVADVQKDLELQAENLEVTSEPQVENDTSEELLPVSVSPQNILSIGLAIALAVLIISIAVQFYGWT